MTKKLKTIVVEDERLPRLSLLQKLEDYPHVEVVDACDSYERARESILANRPDLLFLDIQLRGQNSISLLEELRNTIRLPYVIFTTAYTDSKYLMSAIKLSAVDYLVKPIGKAELSHAIAKVTDRAETGGKLCFKVVGSLLFLESADLAAVRADGNYSRLISFAGEDLALESLLSIERRLPSPPFVRVDRSTMINLPLVSRVNTHEHTCTLQSLDGRVHEQSLSAKGIETLLERLGPVQL